MIDSLTGLFNRTTLFTQLKDLAHKALQNDTPLGLLLIDIRRFNKINANYGYLAGDKVLQAVAKTLNTVCREGDMIARIADDQFVLVLSRVANMGHAQLAALKIQRLIDSPIELDNRIINFKATIGIGLLPSQAQDTEALLQVANRALVQAKKMDQPIGCLKQEEINPGTEECDIEIALSDSINNSELEVYFQPKISLITGEPIGAEALVRWQHPERGLLFPGDFLPAAEAIGFLKPLSIWVLNSALRHSIDWTEKWGILGVSVNIPPSMMEQPDFIDLVLSAKNLWQRDSSHLCLEVLEQSLIDDVQLVFERLSELRETGIQVSIDDFGTGYSSLSYFRDIPADELKIDRSFVMDIATDSVSKNIVSLIIETAQLFNLKVVAEGVEDEETLSYLKSKGCDYAQGYYVARPMPAADFKLWLENYAPA